MTAAALSRDVQEIAALHLREDAERRGEVFVYESPDLPGQWVSRDAVTDVVSQGNSRPHALAMLAEALALHAGEALPTGEAAAGARTVDAVAREVVAWAGTPAGLLAMMAHRGKQDLVALATAVLQRGALLAVLKAGELADRERVGEDEIVAEATPQDLENPAPPWPSVPQNAWSREQTEGEFVGRGILAPDALGVLRPTVFGLLCYGRQPQAHRGLRSAFVELCRYAGTDRAADVILRGEAKGRLDEQVEAAVDWLRALEGLALPHVVLSLAVRSAVAHRDYDITGSKVLVEVFTDRIDVTWPGLGRENPRISARLQCPAEALLPISRLLSSLQLAAPQQQVSEDGNYVRLTLRLTPKEARPT